MVILKEITVLTTQYNQWIRITDEIERVLAESKIQDGIVNVISRHTTTGVTVNESLDWPYAHARMLRDYGSTAGNPTGHLKSLMTGNHCHLVVSGGRLERGGAQEVYFCEFDGPAKRTLMVQIMGE